MRGPLNCGHFSRDIWDAEKKHLIEVPERCKQLRIEGQGEHVGHRIVQLLEKPTAKGRFVDSLELPSNGIKGVLGRRVAKVLQDRDKYWGGVQMHRLDLSDNDLMDEGALGVAELLSSFNGQKITHLDLRGNNIGEEGMIAIADALVENGAVALQHLNLAANDMGDRGAMVLATALRQQKRAYLTGLRPLKCLHVSANGMSDVGVTAVLRGVCEMATVVDRIDIGGNGAGCQSLIR